ncbi:unnamed protein product [Effrenium voratum]|uniref:Peptidase C14 caspase domain-containing protein n=1 Tax=Effrenium voratum TaxID=2562239 RepID=A0AA36MKK1_9DINO|nr:unnamed protein product [Effrenium voratum]
MACHGVQVPNDVLFQLIDSHPNKQGDDDVIKLSDLIQRIRPLVKPHCKLVFVLDCCRSASDDAPPMETWSPPSASRREVFIGFACAPQRASLEDTQAGRGVFTKHFVKYLSTESNFSVAWQRTRNDVFCGDEEIARSMVHQQLFFLEYF